MMPAASISSLYRSLLREANKLPYGYLRAFFRFKFRDDVASFARSIAHNRESSTTKLKRLERECRQLKAANDGHKEAIVRLLDLAYGRTGKLRRELLEPFLHASAVEAPAPIIPGVEKSRPPVYTREMKALLTSNLSRTNKKGLKAEAIKTPPSLPSRVDPESEEARLRGPLSRRREVNARWRLFAEESKRLYPPFQVSVVNVDRGPGSLMAMSGSNQSEKLRDVGLICGGFQDSGLLESLESMTSGRNEPAKALQDRKAPEYSNGESQAIDQTAPVLPSRILRRAHQRLLGKLPVLTFCHKRSAPEGNSQSIGSYEIGLPQQAISSNLYRSTSHLPLIDEKNMVWIRRAQKINEQKTAMEEAAS